MRGRFSPRKSCLLLFAFIYALCTIRPQPQMSPWNFASVQICLLHSLLCKDSQRRAFCFFFAEKKKEEKANFVVMLNEEKPLNFIEEIIEEDLRKGTHDGRVLTRFPPEPNGYLHIGHAKSICLNFGLAQRYNGKTNLRFDDTNPVTEETEYVDSIKQDIQWLGFQWAEELYTSDYFETLYTFAIDLINKGLAY